VRDRSEKRLVKALRERRREAYEDVIDAHYASVYRLLLFLTRNASLAEDLTQEVFTSAWGAIDEFRGASSIATWLHRIAYHSFVDAQRRQERDRSLAAGLSEGGPGMAADPLSRVMADEHLGRICRALEDLRVEERAILLLHYVDGLSYREMAGVLGQPEGTIKWLTSCALEKLRTRLTERQNHEHGLEKRAE
jgi:RNA polymerase sigma-70 factor (ECF subfamily)